jgi:hypothetical protein
LGQYCEEAIVRISDFLWSNQFQLVFIIGLNFGFILGLIVEKVLSLRDFAENALNNLERETGLKPATFALARRRSIN